jgi:hypothetical protein
MRIMHPYLLSQVAQQHSADLRRSAAKAQLARTALDRTAADHTAATRSAAASAAADQLAAGRGAAGRPTTIRTRTGWTLVQIGLRLATSSADTRPSSARA